MGAAAVGAVVGFMVIGPLTAVVAGGAALYGKFYQYFSSVCRTIFQSTNIAFPTCSYNSW
jgi:hypothetical protein